MPAIVCSHAAIEVGFSDATVEVVEGASVVVLGITASAVGVTNVEFYTIDGTARGSVCEYTLLLFV